MAPTFIDLFSGCGGFTLGMIRAGFQCLAAIDNKEVAIQTLRENLVDSTAPGCRPVGKALVRDLTRFTPEELAKEIGTTSLDVIVGGPPCQGFSTARQSDGANHGARLKEDPRRHLYRYFLNYVEFFKPKIFVIENVLGLRTAAGGTYFTAVQHESRMIGGKNGFPGYRVHAQEEKAELLGVPQKRHRLIIVGVRADIPAYFAEHLMPSLRSVQGVTLGDAIMDLPRLLAGQEWTEADYDLSRRAKSFAERGVLAERYVQEVLEVKYADTLLNHSARAHSERDLRDFKLIREGSSSATMMREGVGFEFPYDKNTFKDRYTRQSRKAPCSTITAHLSKDGLMFIHPTQNRSLTPREAARLQSFPDWFRFPESRTHAFTMIGNAVPPLVSESIGNALLGVLKECESSNGATWVVNDDVRAEIGPLYSISCASVAELRKMDTASLLNAWHSVLGRFPNLDPRNALGHGGDHFFMPGCDSFLSERYLRTHWPCSLELMGNEVWRRFRNNDLTCSDVFHKPIIVTGRAICKQRRLVVTT